MPKECCSRCHFPRDLLTLFFTIPEEARGGACSHLGPTATAGGGEAESGPHEAAAGRTGAVQRL